MNLLFCWCLSDISASFLFVCHHCPSVVFVRHHRCALLSHCLVIVPYCAHHAQAPHGIYELLFIILVFRLSGSVCLPFLYVL